LEHAAVIHHRQKMDVTFQKQRNSVHDMAVASTSATKAMMLPMSVSRNGGDAPRVADVL